MEDLEETQPFTEAQEPQLYSNAIYWVYVCQVLYSIHEIIHVVDDPPRDLEKNKILFNNTIFLDGVQVCLVMMTQYVLSINIYVTMGCFFLYSIPVIVFLQQSQEYQSIWGSFTFCTFTLFSLLFPLSYFTVKARRKAWSDSRKVEELLKEQREIIQHIPEGAIVYEIEKDDAPNADSN